MITVEEAKRIVMAEVRPTAAALVGIDHALGRVLAEDVVARYPYPLFDMSAVDGYAVHGAGPSWSIVGAVAAGGVHPRALAPGEGVRIFTGAAVPEGATSVLMQEHCTVTDRVVRAMGPVKERSNIRFRAEGHGPGAPLLGRGHRLDAPSIGLLAADGVEHVKVHGPVEVGILCSGNEFAAPGTAPAPGRIFSSNGRMLESALRSAGCGIGDGARTVPDVEDRLTEAFEEACSRAQLIVTTGGVSVGEHDLLPPVLQRLGARIHLHGVAQKPGKPLLFATWKGVPVFALPGNPRAVMVLFWEYVLPFVRTMQGAPEPGPRTSMLPIAQDVVVKGERAEFRAARVRDGAVTLLADEGSHLLGSLIEADALAYLPAAQRTWRKGDPVELHSIPR